MSRKQDEEKEAEATKRISSDDGGDQWPGWVRYGRVWPRMPWTWDEQSRPGEAASARAGRWWLANVWCRPCHELVTWPQCDGGWPGTEQCDTRALSRVRWHSESGAETGTRLWHSVRDTPGTGRHRDTSVTVWHSDVTRNTDNIITLESFATHGCVRVL